MAFNYKTIREIERLTDDNQHIEALILGAQMLKLKSLTKKFQLIGIICRMEGHVPTGIGKYRDTLYEKLMKYAKKTLSSTEFRAFYAAY